MDGCCVCVPHGADGHWRTKGHRRGVPAGDSVDRGTSGAAGHHGWPLEESSRMSGLSSQTSPSRRVNVMHGTYSYTLREVVGQLRIATIVFGESQLQD